MVRCCITKCFEPSVTGVTVSGINFDFCVTHKLVLNPYNNLVVRYA